MRWVLVCEEAIGQRLVRQLDGKLQQVAAVVSENPVVKRLCRQRDLRCEPLNASTGLAKLPELCQEVNATAVLNVHAFRILPAAALMDAGILALNVHPSLLPDLAGVYPYCWAIQYGRINHGVTIHFIRDKIDSGPVFDQRHWRLAENETAYSLFDKCEKQAEEMVLSLLNTNDRMLHNQILDAPEQSTDGRVYRGFKDIKSGLKISERTTIAEASALIRSRDFRPYRAPWPSIELRHEGETWTIRGLDNSQDVPLVVSLADGKLRLNATRQGA